MMRGLSAAASFARRLNEAIEELRSGGGEPHDLIDPDSAPADVSAA
jgi:antitoxin YefM